MKKNKKGFGNLINIFVGLMVVVIIAVSVVIPTINQTIANGNVTGTPKTLLELVPLFLVLAILMIAVGLVGFRK